MDKPNTWFVGQFKEGDYNISADGEDIVAEGIKNAADAHLMAAAPALREALKKLVFYVNQEMIAGKIDLSEYVLVAEQAIKKSEPTN